MNWVYVFFFLGGGAGLAFGPKFLNCNYAEVQRDRGGLCAVTGSVCEV